MGDSLGLYDRSDDHRQAPSTYRAKRWSYGSTGAPSPGRAVLPSSISTNMDMHLVHACGVARRGARHGRVRHSSSATLPQRLFPADSQAINATHDWATDTAALAPSDSLRCYPPPAQDAEEQEGRPGKWVRGVS